MHNTLIFSNFKCNFKIRKSMKKLDSSQDKDSFLEELKHLHKENKKLASQKDKIKAKYDKTKKELKKKTFRR